MGSQDDFRLGFDPRVRLEFHGSKISSDGGLLLYRVLDDALDLVDKTVGFLRNTHKGNSGVHTLIGLLRQWVFGRLAGYEDVNDAARLSPDPVMRRIISGRAVDGQAASSSQVGRFETEVLATAANRDALADMPGQWIDAVHTASCTDSALLSDWASMTRILSSSDTVVLSAVFSISRLQDLISNSMRLAISRTHALS